MERECIDNFSMSRVNYNDEYIHEKYTLSERQPTPYKDCPSSSPSPPPSRPGTPVGRPASWQSSPPSPASRRTSPTSPASSTTTDTPDLTPRVEKDEEGAGQYILPKIRSPSIVSPWTSEELLYDYESDDEREEEIENKKTKEGPKTNTKRKAEDIEPENTKRNKGQQYLEEIDELFDKLASEFEVKEDKEEGRSQQECAGTVQTGANPVGQTNEYCQKTKNQAIYQFKEMDRVFYCSLEISGQRFTNLVFTGQDKKKKTAKAKAAKEFLQYLSVVKNE